MEKHIIVGIHITDRMKKSGEVQKVFTEYGCNIRTRLGLHGADGNVCPVNGIVILEMVGDEKLCHEMAAKLAAIQGVEVQKMIFK
jgi:hypothetical protein